MIEYSVVGFDIRKLPLLDLGCSKKLGEHWPSDGPCLPPYPASMGEHMWPRIDALEGFPTNSLNLMFLPDSQFLARDALSVAFAMRVENAIEYAKRGYIFQVPEEHLNAEFHWQLLGFDVIDAYGQYSGFYGFTWKHGELTSLLAGIDVVFNRVGLLDDEDVAEQLARVFTGRIAEHAPFYPVKVWAQIRLDE